MAYHLCRDFKPPLAIDNWDWGSTYVLALFLRRVLGYSYVGSTNFKINTVGTFLLATGDTTPSSTPNFGGDTASIDGYYQVTIPVGIRVVSAADVGRVLVLKSPANPTYNSGVFVIIGYNVPGNYYTIDYRSSDASIVESGLLWYLYESAGTLKGAGNMTRGTVGSGTYKGRGTSTNSRLILQSPHSTGWQVRLCVETNTDWQDNNGLTCPSQTHTIGGNGAGDGYGDWSINDVQKPHCHVPLFFDAAAANASYQATGCGTYNWSGTNSAATINRTTLAGDDTGQYCFQVYRTDLINGVGFLSYMMSMFGICDNEPDHTIATKYRMFQFGLNWGMGVTSGTSGIRLANSITVGGNVAGFCWGYSQIPINASFAPWIHSWSTYPYTQANLADSPWIGATELLPIDLVGGANVYWPKTIYEPRVLGTIPCIKAGRTNFGNWSLTTDKSWQHLQNEIYMQWGGPTVMP